MCTADVARAGFLNSDLDCTRPTTRSVRFAMKLPRCGSAFNASSVAAGARGREQGGAARDGGTVPRAAARGRDRSSGVRRCQSASAARRSVPAVQPGADRLLHKSRSHSQEPVVAAAAAAAACRVESTQELPIPPYKGGRDRHSSSFSVDKNDLARMYDYATWNMYERIVSARRQRSSQVDAGRESPAARQAAGRRASEPDSRQPDAATLAAAAGGGKQQQPLYKASSQDESTAATADETDKSSTTSSSWSRTDSPRTIPGLGFPAIEPREVSSCPPPALDGDENEDHFIFQLDM